MSQGPSLPQLVPVHWGMLLDPPAALPPTAEVPPATVPALLPPEVTTPPVPPPPEPALPPVPVAELPPVPPVPSGFLVSTMLPLYGVPRSGFGIAVISDPFTQYE